MKTVLAYDLGGSALKAGLVDQTGQVVASVATALRFSEPCPFWSEADPLQWWLTMVSLTRELLSRPAAVDSKIVAVVVCGMTRTQVFVDAAGRPVRPAITWADGRATGEADRLSALSSGTDAENTVFGPVNAYHTLARMLWVRENEPQVYEATAHVLEPKDFLNFGLTGRVAGDRISLSRVLSKTTGGLAEGLIRSADLSPDLIPPLFDPFDRLGVVQPGLDAPFDCLAGIPVFVGGMDAWCASVGMGCTFDGCAINISGTSEVFGLVVSEFLESEGLITVPWGEGLYHIGGPSQVGADCLRWFLETFCAGSQGIDPYDLLTDLKCCRRRSRPIIFLPYLRGERTPLWDPEARGLFLGINRNHARTDFLWAVLEGVALANRQILDLATGGYPARADQVRIGGGAARSDLWCQVKADVLQLPVIRTAAAETGLLGSALLGWCGLGTYSSLAEGQSKMIRIERTFEPQSGPGGQRARAYDLIYERFLDIQAVALPLFRSLAKAERDGLALGV